MCKVMVRVGVKKWLIIERQGRVISGSRVQQKSLYALKPGDRMDGRMGSWEGSYEKRRQAGPRVLGTQVPPRRIEACELGQAGRESVTGGMHRSVGVSGRSSQDPCKHIAPQWIEQRPPRGT